MAIQGCFLGWIGIGDFVLVAFTSSGWIWVAFYVVLIWAAFLYDFKAAFLKNLNFV
jgi:hypothetical protein